MDLTGAFGRPLAKAGGRLADLIVPHQCVLCRRFAETTGLCTACWEDLAPTLSPFLLLGGFGPELYYSNSTASYLPARTTSVGTGVQSTALRKVRLLR